MKQAKFCLERRKDKTGNPIVTNVPIRLFFHIHGNRLEYYTGVRVSNIKNFNPDYWRTGKPIIKANEPEASRKNQLLKDIKVQAERLHDSAVVSGVTPSPDEIKKKLDEQFKGKSIDQRQGESKGKLVLDAFNEFLGYVKQEHAPNTYKKHKTTLDHLQVVFGNRITKMTCDEISDDFIEQFKTGLMTKGYQENNETRSYLWNTMVKYLHSLREFLNWCKKPKRKYFSGEVEIKAVENEINVIYLTADEIEALDTATMPSERLSQIKDVFLFGCYTGMRYGDIFNLKKKDVFEKEIRFYIMKGGSTKWHTVPLVVKSKLILEKYVNSEGAKALPVISNAKMNEGLKEVMKNAGLNESMTIKEVQADGTVLDKEYEKWQLITCHTSRKSFISFAIENDIPESVIKAITGHSKNSKAFHRYYEISAKKKHQQMDKLFGEKNEPLLKAV